MSMQMKAAPLDIVRQQRIHQLEEELHVHLVALHPEKQLAELTKQQTERLAAFERELGVSLVAYESHAPLRLASPSHKQQQRIAEAEKETKLVLVAYELVAEKAIPFETDAVLARLPEAQLRRLKAAEEEVGLTLMAFEDDTRKRD